MTVFNLGGRFLERLENSVKKGAPKAPSKVE
jgi:hypothetical protein